MYGEAEFEVKVFFSKFQGNKNHKFSLILLKKVYADNSILFLDKMKSNTKKGPSSMSLHVKGLLAINLSLPF